MWPFKEKHKVKRFCPNCGKKIDMRDRALSTSERVWCKTCNRFVWISQLWTEKGPYPPFTEEREKLFDDLVSFEARDRQVVLDAVKDTPIEPKFCTFCRTQISQSFLHEYSNFIESRLQCPNCGDIRFYEDVEPARDPSPRDS